jgi:hypothetical protein
MTARFLALYQAPADPEAFGRHYREVHIPPPPICARSAGMRWLNRGPPQNAVGGTRSAGHGQVSRDAGRSRRR